jgi:hypothetical protein
MVMVLGEAILRAVAGADGTWVLGAEAWETRDTWDEAT